ncbi:MAG: radical SAM protein [Candidatus Aenigmarchaeota archaeon]|nr:radical SAM protein [Candidatus Aenigmarchaeota archaeon]
MFCTKALYGNVYRMRSSENIISEMKEVIEKFHVKDIVFYDDNFSAKRDRVIELCDSMIKNNIKIKWKCEARVNLVDRQLLEKMKQAGCYLIAYGVETGNQHLLDVLKKGTTLEQIRAAFKATHAAGIETLAYIMIGIPGETHETIQRTLDFILEIDPGYVQMGIATPYPMTELYDIAKRKGLIEGRDWSEFSYTGDSATPVLRTEALSREELASELKRLMKAFYMRPKYIMKRLLRTRSFSDLKRNISGMNLVRDWSKRPDREQ